MREITASAMAAGASYYMPSVLSGAESCALQTGTYTLGGRGPNAVPLASLESSPEVATIVVPTSGAATIQRLAASVVVRLNQTAIGIGPKALRDGVEIEFNACRLTFRTDDAGEATVAAASNGEEDDDRFTHEYPAFPDASTMQEGTARIVNARTGYTFDLGDSRLVVGRDEGCNIVVSGKGVSRRHCSIAPVRGGYLLRDESVNGTLVNGSRVSGTYLLGNGDIIRVGDDELRVEVEGDASSAPSTTAAPTAILDVSRLRAEHAAAAGAPERPRTPPVANLEIVRGPYSGATFSIDRPVCSIGRSAESDVRIRDESVSAHHATLLRKGPAWFAVDLRSANGTFVNGLRVAGERELTSGCRIKLGRVELTFRSFDDGVETEIVEKRARSWLPEFLASLFSRRSRVVSADA